jgi:hypothetical protein
MSASARSRQRSPRASEPGRARKPAQFRLAASALILLTAGLTLGLTVPQEVHETSGYLAPGSEYFSDIADGQVSCLYRLIRQAVPKGARVYVNSPYSTHIQRLAEVSVGWAVLEPSASRAQFEVDIIPGGCFDVGLSVRRVLVGHS